jgi:hypothetical protein
MMFFAGLAVAAVIALAQLDVNTLKSDLVRTLDSRVGVPIEINGEMSRKLSLRPELVIKDVRILNAKWAKHKYAVQIPEMRVQINLISLLRDSPTIQSVKMIRPVVNIEENKKGESSLKIARKINVPQAIKKSEFAFDLDFGVGSFELEQPQIFFITPELVESFTPDKVKVALQEKGDTFEYSGYIADWDGYYPFIVSFSKYDGARGVYPMRLTVAGNVIPLVADIALDGKTKAPVEVSAKGVVDELPTIGKSFGLGLPKIARAEFALNASIGKKSVNLKKFSVKSRGGDMLISGKYDFSAKKPKITASIKSDRFDLVEFFPNLYGEKGAKWVHPPRDLNIFKDIPLYGETLSLIDADVKIEANSMRVYRGLLARSVNAGIDIKDGQGLVSLDSNFMGGAVKAKMRMLDAGGGLLSVSAAGTGTGVVVGDILTSVDEPDYVSDLPVNFDFYMRASGYDLSDIAKSATGPVRIVSSSAGYAHEGLLGFIYGKDFLTALRDGAVGIFSGKKNNRMKISCAVANLKIRNGKTELDRNVAVQTAAVNIRVVGGVDFGGENMNLSLDTRPIDGLRISVSGNLVNSIAFTGNLAEPELKVNGDAVMKTLAAAAGFGAAAGILTGGVGFLVGAGVGLVGGDVLGNWTADETPCRTALRDGAPKRRRRDPEFMDRPVEELAAEFLGR